MPDQITRDLLDGTAFSLGQIGALACELAGPKRTGRLRDVLVVRRAANGGRALEGLADELDELVAQIRAEVASVRERLAAAQVIHPVIADGR